MIKLKQLCHLKKKYGFISSYESFHVLKAKDIGMLLLDKIYTERNIAGYVGDKIFAFCEEMGLDRDNLLLKYIKNADLSKSVGVCIELAKQFRNDDFRAEAAMVIAPSCELPWDQTLIQLFERVLSLKTLPEMT